jgi:hypothetical protein
MCVEQCLHFPVPGRFAPVERAPGTHWIGGWVDPRDGLDEVEKILDPNRTRTRTLDRPAHSQSLYRLRYPGSLQYVFMA